MISFASERKVQMETMPYLWTEDESIEEVKHRLLCTKVELVTARMEANTEIKKYEDTIKRLFKLLKTVCQERDEARDQLQLLLKYFQPSMERSTKQSDMSSTSKAFSYSSDDLSLASLQSNEKHSSTDFSHSRIAESSNLASPKQPNDQNKASKDDNMVDRASLMIDKLVWGKPLPKKGRLLQTVTEAGPLLQTLVVAPAPKWQNPLSLSSSSNVDDKGSVNPNGVVPITSLSLAFPGNSRGPSQMSSASGSGLSVKNEPLSYVDMDSNKMHDHIVAGKKRKLL